MGYLRLIAIMCLFLFSSIVVNQEFAKASNNSDSVAVAQEKNVIKYVNLKGGLILRESSDSKGKKISMLKDGSKVFVYSIDENGWAYIKQGKLRGYTKDSFLTIKKKTTKTTTKTTTKKIKEQTSKATTKTKVYGEVKGTVIWKYNDYIGYKGDAGATVYLFSKNATYPIYKKEQLFSWIDGEKDLKDIYQTKVDVNGNYTLEDVPVGKYIGVISSKNTTRNILEELQPNKSLKSLIGEFNYDIFEANRLTLQKHIIKDIEVKVDKTTEFSADFGYTYF